MVDMGSSTVKAGYAGEDTPKAVFPSAVGWIMKDQLSAGGNDGGDVEMKEAKGVARKGGRKKAGGDKNSVEEEEDDDRVGKKGTAGGLVVNHDSAKTKHFYVDDLSYRRDGVEITSPFDENGHVQDWDVVEAIWEHTLRTRLVVQSDEHPILLGEPVNASRETREKMVELLFEKHNPPAVFLAKNPVLTSFASGRATSLIVDCGAGGTTVTAVHDGYALRNAVTRSPLGGDALTDVVLSYLEKTKRTQVRPRFEFTKTQKGADSFDISVVKGLGGTSVGYRLYKQREIAADLKETVCRMSDKAFHSGDMENVPSVAYELPDGNVVEVGAERFKIPEILFNPDLVKELGLPSDKTPSWRDPNDPNQPLKGLPQIILDTISKCDVDARKDLFGGVVVAGGGSLFASLRERLESELHDAAPTNVRVKVTASQNTVERKFTTWIGGSILASLGSFQQMWLSKQEYEEHGAGLIHKRCP